MVKSLFGKVWPARHDIEQAAAYVATLLNFLTMPDIWLRSNLSVQSGVLLCLSYFILFGLTYSTTNRGHLPFHRKIWRAAILALSIFTFLSLFSMALGVFVGTMMRLAQ